MDASIIPFTLMLLVFYFLIIKPASDERAAHDKLIAGLVKGDRVVTQSGLHGRVSTVGEDTVALEIAKNTLVTLDKKSVVRKLGDDADKN